MLPISCLIYVNIIIKIDRKIYKDSNVNISHFLVEWMRRRDVHLCKAKYDITSFLFSTE